MAPKKTSRLRELRGDRTFLSAAEAAALLGVRRRTLYTYASRGVLRRGKEGYLAEDVRRLAARANAHRGHTAAAAGALRWGAPVLESSITDVSGERLRYRGEDACALALRGRFEEVADLLFGGSDGPWKVARVRSAGAGVDRLLRALPSLGVLPGTASFDRSACRTLVAGLVAAAGGTGRGTVAQRLGRALDVPEAILDRVLVLCADHELNASTFAARIAASAGASLPAVLGAALYTFTGRRHGAATVRVEALLSAIAPGDARAVRKRLAVGETVAGFGHPLYPTGDPRAALLFATADEVVRDRAALAHALAIRAEVEGTTGVRASVDFALVALCRALGLRDGTAMLLFALGRSAGWLAHALEQREQGELLRPRARYVGK